METAEFLRCFLCLKSYNQLSSHTFFKFLKLQDRFSVLQGIVSFLTIWRILHDVSQTQ